jgi:hypothetical protein
MSETEVSVANPALGEDPSELDADPDSADVSEREAESDEAAPPAAVRAAVERAVAAAGDALLALREHERDALLAGELRRVFGASALACHIASAALELETAFVAVCGSRAASARPSARLDAGRAALRDAAAAVERTLVAAAGVFREAGKVGGGLANAVAGGPLRLDFFDASLASATTAAAAAAPHLLGGLGATSTPFAHHGERARTLVASLDILPKALFADRALRTLERRPAPRWTLAQSAVRCRQLQGAMTDLGADVVRLPAMLDESLVGRRQRSGEAGAGALGAPLLAELREFADARAIFGDFNYESIVTRLGDPRPDARVDCVSVCGGLLLIARGLCACVSCLCCVSSVF